MKRIIVTVAAFLQPFIICLLAGGDYTKTGELPMFSYIFGCILAGAAWTFPGWKDE